jgi:ABC-type branched-subunit amino acid transport system substrate-binding protein
MLLRLLLLTIQIFIVSNLLHAEELERYAVGIVNPSTGIFSSVGADCQQGFDTAISELSPEVRSRFDFIIEDDQSLAKMAVSALQKVLLKENLIATTVFGASSALATSSVAHNHQLPQMALCAHPDLYQKNPYAFGHWSQYSIETASYLDHVRKGNFKKIAIITTENDYTIALRKLFITGLSDLGVEVVVDELINDNTDYRSLVPKIINKKADLVFLNVFDPSFSLLLKQLYEQRYIGGKMSLGANAGNNILRKINVTASEGTSFYVVDYNQPFFLKLIGDKVDSIDNLVYAFSCYLGMKRLLNTALPLLYKSELSRSTLFQALNQQQSLDIGDFSISLKDRYMAFSFAKAVARQGRAVIEK